MKSFVISAMFVALHLCAAQKFPEAGVHFPSDNSENKVRLKNSVRSSFFVLYNSFFVSKISENMGH